MNSLVLEDIIGRKLETIKTRSQRKLSITKIWRKEKHKRNFFKGTWNKCAKYGQRASDFWRNGKKRNKNKNNRKPWINRKCSNWGKKFHRAVHCWYKKKDKDDDVDNIFVGGVFYVEIPNSDKEEDPKQCLWDSSASLHIT